MRKWLIILVLACMLAVPAQTFTNTYAYAAALPEESDPDAGDMTDEDKARYAGWIVGDVIDLIVSQYVGDPVTPEDLYEAALRGIMTTLDIYSEYMDEYDFEGFTDSMAGKLTGIGVVLHYNDEEKPEILRVLPDTPAEDKGVRRGDIITAVNGQTVEGLSIDDIVMLITDPEIQSVTLQVSRAGEPMTFRMQKREIKSVTVFTDRFENILGPEVAEEAAPYRYIVITSISDSTADDFKAALDACRAEGVTGIVLDLRSNPGGYLHTAEDICRQLVPEGPIYHTIDSQGNTQTVASSLAVSPFTEIVVLVDENTASAAELITAALQDAGAAVVVGEKTFGKGVIQTLYPLSTGGAIKLTTEEYLRRSGAPINNIGVSPDVWIAMNPREYETPQDEALIHALAVLMH